MSGWLGSSGDLSGTGMSYVTASGGLTSGLLQLLMADDIVPGVPTSYQVCKQIFLYHPLGGRMASGPLTLAQSQERLLSLQDAPDLVLDRFKAVRRELGADQHIFATGRNARIYGHAATVAVADGVDPMKPLDARSWATAKMTFNDYDPLNTSSSMNMNQDPNKTNFLKMDHLVVNGIQYHPSRGFVLMNEDPVYLDYVPSGFGFTGRSVFQRGLFPLKSFLQSMITDDMVTQKAGLLVAKMKQNGSIMDSLMASVAGIKRAILRQGGTGNVLSVGSDDSIESIDLKNIDGALITARKNVLDNIAVACDMPSKLLDSKSYAAGFGEGTEDAKAVSQYISRIRVWLQPLYAWFDAITMTRAWTPEFFATIQAEFPEPYATMGYLEAFYKWKNAFQATWPNLLEEPESEKVKVEETKFKSMLGVVQTSLPVIGHRNRTIIMNWMADQLNEQSTLFTAPLEWDQDELLEYNPPADRVPEPEKLKVPKPTAKNRLK